jgi:hypothetical protein
MPYLFNIFITFIYILIAFIESIPDFILTRPNAGRVIPEQDLDG